MQMVKQIKLVVNSDSCIEMELDILRGLQIPITDLIENKLYDRIRTSVLYNNGPANAAYRKTNDLQTYLMFDRCDINSLEIQEMDIEIDNERYSIYHDLIADNYKYISKIGAFIITPDQIERFRIFGMKHQTPLEKIFYNGYYLTDLMIRINEKAHPNIAAMAG